MGLKNRKILIVGLVKTSLIESLEIFLASRVLCLGVIGVMSPFAPKNDSHCLLYEHGVLKKTWGLPAYLIQRVTWWNYPLMLISYFVYIYSYLYSVILIRQKFEVYIGVSMFSALFGLLLKKLGVVRFVIYYCLDYYPEPKSFGFHAGVNYVFRKIEPFLVKHVDVVWELSSKITAARKKYLQCVPDKKVDVPVGYSEQIMRCLQMEDRARYDIAFIGSLSENQGLQLAVESMKELQKTFPQLKVHVIGHGTYAETIRKIVTDHDVNNSFIFHGFLSEEKKAYEILSHCAMAIAPYMGGASDNAVFTEPGKPKLFLILGLPVLITDQTQISIEIEKHHAGIRIKYSKHQFIDGVTKILKSDKCLQTYYDGVKKMQKTCTSEVIYTKAFEETFQLLNT